VGDYRFIVSSSLGIIAREYEVGQLVQLLQTTSPDSPIYATLIESVVDNMNLSNREQILKLLKQAQQPTPEQQAAQKRGLEREEEAHRAQVAVFAGQADEFNARAAKYKKETELAGKELQIKLIDAIVDSLPKDDSGEQFKRRLETAKLVLSQRGKENGTNQNRV